MPGLEVQLLLQKGLQVPRTGRHSQFPEHCRGSGCQALPGPFCSKGVVLPGGSPITRGRPGLEPCVQLLECRGPAGHTCCAWLTLPESEFGKEARGGGSQLWLHINSGCTSESAGRLSKRSAAGSEMEEGGTRGDWGISSS